MDELWTEIQNLQPDFPKAMTLIEAELIESIPSEQPTVLYNASKHLIRTGGKRIRPVMLLLAHRAVNGNGSLNGALPIAVAIELIHTATLIHDDIIDKSSMRRRAQTVNARWGNDAALIAGDLLFSKAFGMVGTHKDPRLSAIMSRACMKLAEGEILDMLHTGDVEMTEEVYLEVVERKTASLTEAASKCGAVLGGADDEGIEALANYGYNLGAGFQIMDDILDVISGEFKLGKPIGLDITLGKPTLVILHALKVASDSEKEALEKILKGEIKSNSEVKEALEIVKGTNSIEYATKRAKSLIKRAKSSLEVLEDSNAKKALELVADYAVSRDF